MLPMLKVYGAGNGALRFTVLVHGDLLSGRWSALYLVAIDIE